MARYALVIGIAKYDKLSPNLPKAATDAEKIAQVLREHGRFDVQPLPGKLVGSNNYRCVAPDKKLTGKELGSTLRTFLLEKAKGHEALIYFAGHGFEAPTLTGKQKGYLATSDCSKNGQNAIAFDDFNDLIRESELSSLVVVLDCCHAGSLLERSLTESAFTAFRYRKDYYLITTCCSGEKARESEENGIFTDTILKGLAAENADEKGQISGERLFDYIAQQLIGSGQEPIRLGWGRSLTLVNYGIKLDLIPNQIQEGLIYQHLRIRLTRSNSIITPEDLKGLKLPDDLEPGKGLVIEGLSPIWLYSYLVAQCNTTSWIGCYDPKLGGAVVVESYTQSVSIGSVFNLTKLPNNSGSTVAEQSNIEPLQLLVTEVSSQNGDQYQCLKINISSNQVLEPEVLNGLDLPTNLDFSQGVVLSGRAPIWLYCYLALRCNQAIWVACYDPRLGAVVVTHSPLFSIGQVIPVNPPNERNSPLTLSGEREIALFHQSLELTERIDDVKTKAATLHQLGLIYAQRGNVEQAIAAYQKALTVYTLDAFPVDWARTQNSLGLALSEKIKGDKAENLELAIACYQAALTVYTREAFPYEWASTCKNLGNAYTDKTHDGRLNNIDCFHNIEYAILFYQDALEIYTHDQFPNECLIIREKLSNAHYLLEYYQRELEFASSPRPIICNEETARIEFVMGNLLDLEVDALVNPTGLDVSFGGEISLQIVQRLGSELYEILRNQPPLRSGEVFLTGAGSLLAHYIIHTPTEENDGRHTTASIVRGISAALTKANSLRDVQTIAFPSIGTGAAGFNPTDLAPKVLKAVTHHLKQSSLLKKVIFAFVDETAYQAYASAYQMLLLETGVAYNVSVTIPQETVSLGEEIEISVNLNQAEITQRETYTIQISHNDAIGSELNIFLTAPGFQFNGDNTTSLPLDPDTTNITQTASFNLTALRPGKTKIKAELYCGDTYKTTLESEVEVTALKETELRPLIAARSRPVPQPDIILQVRTTWNTDNSACTFNYHIDSYQPRLLFADDVDYNSQSLSATWVERYSEGVASRSHSLLKTTLEEAASSLPGDFRSRLVSLGQYLFQSLLPEELQNTFRTIASLNHPFTLLILADQDAWFPWELLHDGQKFLGDRFIIGRWLWELEKARPYEFPVGAVNVAHYASVEQPELWTELLHSSGAPPPIPMQAGVFNDMTLFESIRGLHLIRYGQYVDTTNRQDAPVRVNSSSNIEDIEREVQPAKLSLRRNHPLVTLSYLNAGQPELTALEQTWASTFVRAGCSAFVGSLWAVQPNVEAAFVSAFYHSIWAGQTLGMAFQTARRLAKTVVPESLDWLAYVLFGDPMARPYRPVQGQGYGVVEPIGQEIDDPVSPESTVRFRVSLRRTPPVWYENRLMEVAEDLIFDDLRVFIVTSGLQVTPDDSIVMRRTATKDYLGWFTLTIPAEMEGETVLVQVHFEDGMEPVHGLRFSLKVGTSSLPSYSQPRQRKRQQRQKQSLMERSGEG